MVAHDLFGKPVSAFPDHAPATSQEVRLELSGGVGSLP
jgi:hypothetical protein